MEENKYYTPEIEEFHVGFEYEENLKNNGKWGWEKQVVEGIYPFDYYEDLLQPESLAIRVKHLDPEDIESLGFKYNKERDEYVKSNIVIEFIGKTSITIGRYQEDYPMGEYTSWTDDLFQGTIKNKSELKRVLKMIGI